MDERLRAFLGLHDEAVFEDMARARLAQVREAIERDTDAAALRALLDAGVLALDVVDGEVVLTGDGIGPVVVEWVEGDEEAGEDGYLAYWPKRFRWPRGWVVDDDEPERRSAKKALWVARFAAERAAAFEEPICPVMSAGMEGYAVCLGPRCAWWEEETEGCGLVRDERARLEEVKRW